MASGGEGSRNLNKGKGPLQDFLEHQGDDVSYNDRLYHEFLQSQFGSDLPRSPNPPLIISDEPDPNLYDPDSNENLSTPQPPSNEFVAGEEEKPMKSDLFKLHMKKIQLDDGMIQIKCKYCSKIYRTNKSFGYGTYWNHIRKNHPSELGLGDRLFSQRAKKLRTSSSSSSGSISELDRYLETSHEFLEDSEFSIQVWWKDHEQIFPILAIIAKQILGTPVSTVAVEQEFSAGGNILEPRRSVMCPQTLEAQACLDDWTKAKYRQQEIEAEIVNDFFEDDQTTGTEGSD
ncbi:hypothetical protein Dsin_005316 [Dipteronia sinensis]|uniref:HAT C-terminal dimerisation domain-containing protein n=1 Tax=Dipteronia sinensis TaxID=43782 RepID=A0AAE0AXN4_9ROSI|nr:hypothetical protein Dsin_005316 [Dipteronia sinensis]